MGVCISKSTKSQSPPVSTKVDPLTKVDPATAFATFANSQEAGPTQENFNILLYAEQQKKGKSKWEGILAAYAALSKYKKSSSDTILALLDQGEAAEKLGGRRRAKGYYEKALKKIPLKNI